MNARNCLLVLVLAAASVHGCSARRPAGSEQPPRRPALGTLVERAGRPLTGNGLIEPLGPRDVSDGRKEAYNRAAPASWPGFVPDLEATLALYDGLDGVCGDQWLAERATERRGYRALAERLADDRLWLDSRAVVCERFLAVELADSLAPGDCGGRTPTVDAVDVFRSLLVRGAVAGIEDGVARDDRSHSITAFPFLAAP